MANFDLLCDLELDFDDFELALAVVDSNHCVGYLIRIENVLVKVYHHVG